MDALGVDTSRGTHGPDVEEHSAEQHEANEEKQPKDAIPGAVQVQVQVHFRRS